MTAPSAPTFIPCANRCRDDDGSPKPAQTFMPDGVTPVCGKCGQYAWLTAAERREIRRLDYGRRESEARAACREAAAARPVLRGHPGSRVVTPEQARRVVDLARAGNLQRDVALDVGVSQATVTAILQGWHWSVREGHAPRYLDGPRHG